ncbi:MAG: hypothetical protein RR994_00010, partial [Clostridia bacterium]
MENTKKSPWSEVYGWSWINKEEVMDMTYEDFRKRAKQIHDDGVTIVIDFSMTHYRMSFGPYIDKINACLKMFADACHEYGLKLVEHHSSSLILNLWNSDGWKRLEADFGSFSNWKSDVYDWPEVPRYILGEPRFYGELIHEMLSIDGRTGEIANSPYDSYCICYNNPVYRRAYFAYMRDLIKTGIDGIMNDDIQYYADGNACACPHCRKLFHEKTGYTLPTPDKWNEFYDDYENPAFLAYKRFKSETTHDFFHDLSDLYEEIGVNLIRPNYVSATLASNWTAYGFDSCLDIWNVIYQENCFSTVIKASYPDYMIEAVHRSAAAERTGASSMSQFYAERPDTIYFGWANARAWGQLYSGSPEGINITDLERKVRKFEQEHTRFYEAPKKLRDVSFYFSRKTRDFTKDAIEKYMLPFMSELQASCASLLSTDMVFEDDSLEELGHHACIVVSHVAQATDEEIVRLKEYAKAGGKLVISGIFAELDENNAPREITRVTELLGLPFKFKSANISGDAEVSLYGKTIGLQNVSADKIFDDGSLIKTASVGAGEIVWAPFDMGSIQYQPSLWVDRRVAVQVPEPTCPSRLAMQKANTGALLKMIIGESALDV